MARNVKFRLNQVGTSQLDVKIVLEKANLEEILTGVEEDLVEVGEVLIGVEEVLTGVEEEDLVEVEEVLIGAEMTEDQEKCTKQNVLIVARNVKFRLNQAGISQLGVGNVLLNIEKGKEILISSIIVIKSHENL